MSPSPTLPASAHPAVAASAPTATTRSAEENARLDARLIQLQEQDIRFNAVLGLKVTALRPRVRHHLVMRPELVGHYHYGRLHGGVISATLDALGGLALMVALADKHPGESTEQVMHRFLKLGTIDLRVDYLRPGLGTQFECEAEVLRLGGRVGATQSRLTGEGGELIATATAAYIVS